MKVLITIDVEITLPLSGRWRESRLADEIARDVNGELSDGVFGLPYQLGLLKSYGLRATAFVESLFAREVGVEPLRGIIGMIQANGHEAQPHLHPEWLARMSKPILPERTGRCLSDFSQAEQDTLIAECLRLFRAAGASPYAFRAGNWAFNIDTLRALKRNGIIYDSSYNISFLVPQCRAGMPVSLLGPELIEGIWEIPLSYANCLSGPRPAQLCACSAGEMQSALRGAREAGQYAFVIVLHSFELMHRTTDIRRPNHPCHVLVRRFERLCRFLADNREEFPTVWFSDLPTDRMPAGYHKPAPRISSYQTIWRYAEQLASRVM